MPLGNWFLIGYTFRRTVDAICASAAKWMKEALSVLVHISLNDRACRQTLQEKVRML